MYNLINTHVNQILQFIEDNDSSHVSEYDWLVQNITSVSTTEYRRRYNRYWGINAARLSENFRHVYFQRLEEGLKSLPQINDLVQQLYQIPTRADGLQSLQFSFCSKLCHMLNHQIPMYDAMLRDFYFFTVPKGNLPLQKRIDSYVQFHQFLTIEYSRVLLNSLLSISIRDFRQRFNPQHFTDIKVIDSLIWAFMSLLKKDPIFWQQCRFWA